MRALNVGDLRTHVTFQAKVVSGQDSYGQDVTTWATQLVAWCQIEALQGRELDAAQQIHAEARFRLRTHPRRALLGKHPEPRRLHVLGRLEAILCPR